MPEPVFFVVEKTPIGEQAVLYHGEIPPRLRGAKAAANGLVYAVRVDTLPHGHQWLKMSLAELFAAFLLARAGGGLPPQYQEPALPSAAPAERKLGHRESFSQRPDLPAEPWPTVEELDARAARRRSVA